MSFDLLKKQVEVGMLGKNKGVSMGFPRLNNYVQLRKSLFFLLGGLTGCLSGDTKIKVKRGNRISGREYSLEELYYKFNKLNKPREKHDKRNGHFWDESDSFILSYDSKDNLLKYNKIINVYESGIKKVYLLITKNGKQIKATSEHKFLIDYNDNYKKLENLKINDDVFIRAEKNPKGRNKRKYRKEFLGKFQYYSSAQKKIVNNYVYYRIKKTRAEYDAYLNNVNVKDFLKELSINPNHNFIFSDLNKDLHHINEDINDNSFDNLQLLTKEEHARLHGKNSRSSHFGDRTLVKDKIISITEIGKEMTYDIEMDYPLNNFLANDILVHNSGKTTIVDEAFVLNPYDWTLTKEGKASGIKVNFLYFSMERNATFKLAKWLSRKIFLEQGIVLSVDKILGWRNPMNKEEHDLFLHYESYMKEMEKHIQIFQGPENPVGISKKIKEYALSKGKIEQVTDYNKIYIPNDDREITIIIIDHIGLTKTTKDYPTKKDAIDRLSSELQYARDLYGFTPVVISQFNRSISNPIRIKQGDVEPALDDFADSSQTQNDADVVLALFDPMRYNVPDVSGYNLDKLRDDAGKKYFRSLRVIKNTYGADDLRVGLAFYGEIGTFKELPRKKDITDQDYTDILNKTYFLN